MAFFVFSHFQCSNKGLIPSSGSTAEAMCLVSMIDCEGWLASPDDALNAADEALEMSLEIEDRLSPKKMGNKKHSGCIFAIVFLNIPDILMLIIIYAFVVAPFKMVM
jgi:hypothetical protein